MYDSSLRVYGIIRKGTLGDYPHSNTAETENNKHRITAKNVAKHRHRNFKFCPSINLIQMSI